jgi:enamine deaminase RidA (YjgF/YER057c/UK114 family)
MSVRSGNLIFTAGHIPQQADGSLITGKVGADMTAEDAAKAAELCALHIMSTIKGVLLTFRCQQRSKLLYVLCVLYNVYCERHAFASKTQSQY